MIKYTQRPNGRIAINGKEVSNTHILERLNQSVKDKEELRTLRQEVYSLIKVGQGLDHFDRYEITNHDYQTSPFKERINDLLTSFQSIKKMFFIRYPSLKSKEIDR